MATIMAKNDLWTSHQPICYNARVGLPKACISINVHVTQVLKIADTVKMLKWTR